MNLLVIAPIDTNHRMDEDEAQEILGVVSEQFPTAERADVTAFAVPAFVAGPNPVGICPLCGEPFDAAAVAQDPSGEVAHPAGLRSMPCCGRFQLAGDALRSAPAAIVQWVIEVADAPISRFDPTLPLDPDDEQTLAAISEVVGTEVRAFWFSLDRDLR